MAMKRLILLFLAVMPLLFSCVSFEGLVETGGDCILKTPDGRKIKFELARVVSDKLIVSRTGGSSMDEPVSLSLYYEGDLKSGEFKVERMKLSLVSPLSSTVRDDDETQVFSGKVGIAKVADSYLVLRLKNVRYSLPKGEYVLNGDLVVATGELVILDAVIPDGAAGKYHMFVDYWKNDAGTWSTDRDGTTYKYQGLLWGKDGIPEKDVGYVVLTNDLGITFDEVKRSMYSSSSLDWIPKERARLIGFYY